MTLQACWTTTSLSVRPISTSCGMAPSSCEMKRQLLSSSAREPVNSRVVWLRVLQVCQQRRRSADCLETL